MQKTWLIYTRKSVVRDGTDTESIERQLFVCKTRLSLISESVNTEVYQDLDRSGSSEAGRPAWLELKEQLHRPDVVGVIASSLDRLYRNLPEFLEFLNLIEDRDLKLILSKENLDTTTPTGRFVVTILMAMYEMEWRLTSQRMTEMVAHKRLQQGRHWGPAPFWTERDDDGQLIPSTATDANGRHLHDALTEMYRLYASGDYSYDTLTNALNEAGWRYQDRYKQDREFNRDHIRDILARWRVYRGDLPLGNPRKEQDVQWVDGGHEPILPVELCDTVGVQLTQRNKRYKLYTNRRIYLITGIGFCAECGATLGGQKYNGEPYYRHTGSKQACEQKWVKAEPIESQILDALVEFASQDEMLADVRAKLRTMSTPLHTADEGNIIKLQAKLDRVEDLYIDGLIDRDAYLSKRGRVLSEMAVIENTRPNPPAQVAPDNVLASIHIIKNAQPETQRELIASLFTRISIADGEIKTVTPQPWAQPFLTLCRKWAGWESNPSYTMPILLSWLLPERVDVAE